MYERAGDLPPRKGDVFQKKLIELICDLEYKEICRRRFGLDFVAEPPPEKIDIPKGGVPQKVFLRPMFSPMGKTAFEFKAGAKLQLDQICEDLNEKIKKINANKRISVAGIAGGVIATDTKVPSREIKKTLEKHNVYLWDISILCFLTSKVFIRRKWAKPRVAIFEEKINEWASIMRCIGTYTRSNCLKFNVALYYQNPFIPLDLEMTEEMLSLITQRIQEIVRDLTLPTYVGLEVHSLSGTTEEVEENFRKIVKAQSQGLISYVEEEASLTCYDIAPWYCLLSIIKRYIP